MIDEMLTAIILHVKIPIIVKSILEEKPVTKALPLFILHYYLILKDFKTVS